MSFKCKYVHACNIIQSSRYLVEYQKTKKRRLQITGLFYSRPILCCTNKNMKFGYVFVEQLAYFIYSKSIYVLLILVELFTIIVSSTQDPIDRSIGKQFNCYIPILFQAEGNDIYPITMYVIL